MATCGTYTVDLANADELAAFYRNLTSTNTTFIQLSPGPSRFHARTLELDRMSISWIKSSGRHFWHDLMVEGGWRFAFATGSEGTLRLNGQELSFGDAQLLQSGEENIFVTSGDYSTLEITLEKSLVEEMGWHSHAGQLQRIDENRLVALQTVCETAYTAVSGLPRSRNLAAEMRWQGVLLEHLEKSLGPWLCGAAKQVTVGHVGRSHRILKKVREQFFEQSSTSFSNIDALASALGVSRRTLFAAFREELGLGPHKFMELRRLNALRNRLLHADPEATTVACLSNETGFSELGRTAVTYRKLFGEPPSATLRRTAQESSL